jgi:hypothetical protein
MASIVAAGKSRYVMAPGLPVAASGQIFEAASGLPKLHNPGSCPSANGVSTGAEIHAQLIPLGDFVNLEAASPLSTSPVSRHVGGRWKTG